jgi:hypothetical protein
MSSVFGATFTDRTGFEAAVGSVVTIDFEGITTTGGQAGAVNLVGNEFPGVTLTPGPGADGLFVGIPDSTIPGGNNANFFAADFFPTSGVACFSPDTYPSPSPSPDGALVVDFDLRTNGVGAYFLDPEFFASYIEAFDGPHGTGNSLGKVIVQNEPDDAQAFAGIAASGIQSAVLVLGGEGDGVGMDDLIYGRPMEVSLCAGQTMDVGDVQVGNDDTNLYVTYLITEPDTCMIETHLHVAEGIDGIPQTKKGNPIPGQFDYMMDHNCVTEYTYTIPLGTWADDVDLSIAAHAVVKITPISENACADAVFDYTQGTLYNGNPVGTDRSDPNKALGEPDSSRPLINFYSLGFDKLETEEVEGVLSLSFPTFITGELTVYETTYGPYPVELADVFVSRDGTDWTFLGTADNSGTEADFHPSTFYLDGCFQYVKIVDMTDIALFSGFPTTAQAFDVDAVCASNTCNEETAWGGCLGAGSPFEGKNWATYFNYVVQ